MEVLKTYTIYTEQELLEEELQCQLKQSMT